MNDIDVSTAVDFARRFLCGPVLLDDIKAHGPTDEDFLRMGQALQEAAHNPDTNDHDALVSLAADRLTLGAAVPGWLSTFVGEALGGKRKRPTKRGADKYDNWERDYKLWRATQEVAHAFGLQHYSHNELSKKTTAAEIVGQAAGCKTDVVIRAYKRFNQ